MQEFLTTVENRVATQLSLNVFHTDLQSVPGAKSNVAARSPAASHYDYANREGREYASSASPTNTRRHRMRIVSSKAGSNPSESFNALIAGDRAPRIIKTTQTAAAALGVRCGIILDAITSPCPCREAAFEMSGAMWFRPARSTISAARANALERRNCPRFRANNARSTRKVTSDNSSPGRGGQHNTPYLAGWPGKYVSSQGPKAATIHRYKSPRSSHLSV